MRDKIAKAEELIGSLAAERGAWKAKIDSLEYQANNLVDISALYALRYHPPQQAEAVKAAGVITNKIKECLRACRFEDGMDGQAA